MNAAEFNARYPVGTPVIAYPGVRPEDGPGERLITRTRSEAQLFCGHTDVVWVDDHGACIAIDHVDVVSEDVWKAAKEADDLAAATLSRKERTVRLAELRAREAARKVVLRGKPLMELPLEQRIAFAIYDPGALVPRGDNYREPIHHWQARAVTYVLAEEAS